MMAQRNNNEFFKDVGILTLSIVLMIIIVRNNVFAYILTATQGITFLSSFIAGIFFTSVFTAAPAAGALIEIFQNSSLVPVACIAAIGSVCGDYIMFKFMRDTFSEYVLGMMHLQGVRKKIRHVLKPRLFKRFIFVLGALIIASPLPDELGLAMLGLSKTKTSWFLPLSFLCNFAGILLLGIAARALM
jgi:hypothetical protein